MLVYVILVNKLVFQKTLRECVQQKDFKQQEKWKARQRTNELKLHTKSSGYMVGVDQEG